MEISQPTQKQILVKLIHSPGLKFNDLWNKHGPSNKFNYHLKSLVELDLIYKENDLYYLTNNGLTYVSNIDGKSASIKKLPTICSFILGYNSNNCKILVNIRKKEPFYDHLGIPGGKIAFGSSPLITAKEEFFEETGLSGDLKLIALSNYNTYDNKDKNCAIHHVIAFTYLCQNPVGTLIQCNREGENKWIDISQIKNYKRYPESDHFFNTVFNNKEKVNFFNVDRFQDDKRFTSIDILNYF